MSAYFAFFPLSNGLAFRALHLPPSFHGNYTQCWRCPLAVSELKVLEKKLLKNVITKQLREKKSICHLTLTLPDVVWLASLPSRPFYFHCCGVMSPGLWMYILSCGSLSCLVTDFMVIFFPLAHLTQSYWTPVWLVLLMHSAPFPNPMQLFPADTLLMFSPILPFHYVQFPWLPIPAPSFLPVWSCGCLLLTGSVCLVLAGFPLSCLVAHCSGSWFKPPPFQSCCSPSLFFPSCFFSLCVLTACSQSHCCCLTFFLCKCEMFTLSGGQTRVNGVSSCLHTGRGRGS